MFVSVLRCLLLLIFALVELQPAQQLFALG